MPHKGVTAKDSKGVQGMSNKQLRELAKKQQETGRTAGEVLEPRKSTGGKIAPQPTKAEETARASLIDRGIGQPTPAEEQAQASLIGRGDNPSNIDKLIEFLSRSDPFTPQAPGEAVQLAPAGVAIGGGIAKAGAKAITGLAAKAAKSITLDQWKNAISRLKGISISKLEGLTEVQLSRIIPLKTALAFKETPISKGAVKFFQSVQVGSPAWVKRHLESGTSAKEVAAAVAKKFGTGATIIAKNEKNKKLTETMLQKIAIKLKKNPLLIVIGAGAIVGQYAWAEWSQGEAIEIINFATTGAIKTGDPELIQELREVQAEILDQNVWELMARTLTPTSAIIVGFWTKYKALRAQAKVNDKIMENEIIKLTTGETDDAKWERIREQQNQDERDNVDYYNEQSIIFQKRRIELDKQAREAKGQTELAIVRETIKFWNERDALQRELEKKDREAIAEFWLTYHKTLAKLQDESRPSNLNFGLL